VSDEPTAPRRPAGPAADEDPTAPQPAAHEDPTAPQRAVDEDPMAPPRRSRRELHQPARAGALLDFRPLAARLQTVAGVLALATLVAIVVDGLRNGLSFAIMGRWIGLFVAVLLVAAAVSVALHALSGLGAAGRRGERLAGDDVRLLPPVPTRRRRP